MNHGDIAVLMKGAAPAIRDLVLGIVAPLVDRVAALEQQLRERDDEAMIRALVDDAMAKIPPAPAGKDTDPADIARVVNEAVAALPPAKDGAPGKDIDPAAIAEMVSRQVADAVSALPTPEDGKDADPALIAQMVANEVAKIPPPAPGKDADPEMIRAMVDEAVASIPAPVDGKDADPAVVELLVTETVARVFGNWEKPKDGASVTLNDVAPMIESAVAERVALIPAPKDGAPGKLPIVRVWTDEIHREGEVVTFAGSTYQASKDTGRAPPHADWTCIASAGRDGEDGRSPEVRSTYSEDGIYSKLDIVALNGGSFIARKDDPGACPGPDWQLIAAQGKAGKPGERGAPGRGDRGEPGQPVVSAAVDDMGMLTLVNGDGSTVDVDLYPLLSKVN